MKYHGRGLSGWKAMVGRLWAGNQAPGAPVLDEEVEAEPGEDAVQQGQVRHDAGAGFLDQDNALVELEIAGPQPA
jgi:hypothetical protein